MAQGRVRQRLSRYTSKLSTDKDLSFGISLATESKLLPPDEITNIVNVGDVFNTERNDSKKYRFIATINPLIGNSLFNINGDTGPSDFGVQNGFSQNDSYGFKTFNGTLFKEDFLNSVTNGNNTFVGREDFTYEESLKKHLKEVNGWFGFYDPDITKVGECTFYDLEPNRKRFEFDNTIKKNWDLTVTYPASNDTSHHLVDGGLLITTAVQRIFGSRYMVAFATAVPHNLNIGDKVRLNGMGNGMNGDFDVVGLGLEDGEYTDTFFVVNIDSKTTEIASHIGTYFSDRGGRLKRLYFGNEVTYYIRKFKKVKSFSTQKAIENDDYEVYPLGFAKNVYSDNLYQVVFNEDIDISDLKDNLGRPVTELYLTIIKTEDSFFTTIYDGFDMANHEGNVKTTANGVNVSNIRKMHTLGNTTNPFNSHIPLDNTGVKITDNEFYGDIVEYSKYEVKETILSTVNHRFNTIDREISGDVTISDESTNSKLPTKTIEGTRCEGYIYQAHYQMLLRQYSNYVEQGDSSTEGIPDYAEPVGDGRFLWRDLLDIGFNDGKLEVVEYPFLNGCHYIYKNICFPVRRQDPFGVFDLYYSGNGDVGSPKDTLGDAITNNFKVKYSNDAC